jgi:hypothetical protein
MVCVSAFFGGAAKFDFGDAVNALALLILSGVLRDNEGSY